MGDMLLSYRCDGGVGIPGLLQGRKVLVTGGSRGIGASVVRACAGSSAQVGFTYLRNKNAASKLVEEIGEDRVTAYRSDVRDLASMETAMGMFSGSSGTKGLDGLVCCAGVYNRKGLGEMGQEDWDLTMDINLKGTFNAVKAALPHMVRGSIVLLSSQIAFRGTRHGADYAASKAGVLGLARALALELSPKIRVNTISPGYIDTELLSSDTPKRRAERAKEVPLGRVGSPMEVAYGALFLISDLSSYMTGAVLDISGGLSMCH